MRVSSGSIVRVWFDSNSFVHSIDKASKGIWKCYIGSIPMLGASVVQVHISDEC